MNYHDIGQLLGAVAIFVFFLLNARGTTSLNPDRDRPKAEKWQHCVSGTAFLQAWMFIVVALACEAAGMH